MKIFHFFMVCCIISIGCRKSVGPPPPQGIESVNILSGGAFTLVTLQGNGFKSDPYADTVKVNGVMATVLSASTTSITFSVPFCTGSGPITVTTSDGTLMGPTFTYLAGPDVYVCGYQVDPATNNKQRIKYWKNGNETWVTDGSVHSYSSGISVIDNDVFVSGGRDSGLYAKYWKNGSEVRVLPGSVIKDKDLYTAITLNNQFWKNGIPLIISKRDANNYTTGIFVKP